MINRFLGVGFFVWLGFSVNAQQTSQLIVKIDEKSGVDRPVQKYHLDALDKSGKVKTIRPKQAKPSVLDGIYELSVDTDQLKRVKDSLSRLPNVKYIEVVGQEELLYVPNDPDATPGGNQDYLAVIKAYEAWDITRGSSDIVIGIIDTGADLDHEDLNGQLYENNDPVNGVDDDENGYVDDLYGYDFADDDNNPTADGNLHGTHVSGISSAQPDNGIAMAGVGFHSRLSPLKIFTTESNSSRNSYTAIQYAADNDYDVINLSWGSVDSYSQFNQDIINYAVLEKNVVVVAAAGNSGLEQDYYPASYDNVLSVGATYLDDSKTSFSTYGNKLDLMAPGNQIYSTQNGDSYGRDNGTSHAAPMVAGVAALLKSQHPDWTAVDIMERIRATTDDIYSLEANSTLQGKLGSGRLNALRAVNGSAGYSLRPGSIAISSSSGLFFFGDTVTISFDMTNYVDPVIQPQISLQEGNGTFTIESDPQEITYLNRGESVSLEPYQIILSDTLSPGSTVEFGVQSANDQFESLELFDFQLQPDYYDFGHDNNRMTISGNGNLAHPFDPSSGGLGYERREEKLLDQLGIIFATDTFSMANNLPLSFEDGSSRDQDFATSTYLRSYSHPLADHYAISTFDTDSLPLHVQQTLVAWDSLDGLAISYRVSNKGSEPLYDLHSALFANWNIETSVKNKGSWDLENTTYVSNLAEDELAGIRLALDTNAFANILDLESLSDNSLNFSDTLKYSLLSGDKTDSVGFDALTDAATITGTVHDTLDAGESVIIHFVLAGADSLSGLYQNINDIQSNLENVLETPPVSKSIASCLDATISLIPDQDSVAYFSDAAGLDTLLLGDTLMVGPIISDTVIYKSVIYDNYWGPITAVDINIETELARFRIEEDTLFLGDSEFNEIQFYDESIDATDWSWDFGNGSQAVGIANPKSSYHETGSFSIKLTASNVHGCSGDTTQTLSVLTRTEEPALENQVVCVGEAVSLMTESNDVLRYYPTATANDYILEDDTLNLGVFDSDTIVYITRLEDGLESHKREVQITISKLVDGYYYAPVLDSLTGDFALFTAEETDIASSSWYWNGDQITTNSSMTVEVTEGKHALRFDITNSFGCSISLSDSIAFEAGPIPLWSDSLACQYANVVVQPENGTLFSFRADSSVSSTFFKGPSLTIDSIQSDTVFYVANVDSTVSSQVLRVHITAVDFVINIQTSPDTLILDEGVAVDLSTDVEAGKYAWFLDSLLQDTSPAPTFFFDSAGTYEMALLAEHQIGCLSTDSIDYLVLSTRPEDPLGINDHHTLFWPNPASDQLSIDPNVMSTSIISLDGKVLLTSKNHTIDIKSLPVGTFMIHMTLPDGQLLVSKLITRGN